MKKLVLLILTFFVLSFLLGVYPENIFILSGLTAALVCITYFLIAIPSKFLWTWFNKLSKQSTKVDQKTHQIAEAVIKNESSINAKAITSNEKTPLASKAKNDKEIKMEVLVAKHQLMLVSVNKSVSDGQAIYNAARFAWRVDVTRARNVDYVLAHQSGNVVGVFVANQWLSADSNEFSELNTAADPSRWGFVGEVAPSEVLLEYFNKKLPEGFLKKGASNPVRFLSPDQNDTQTSKTSANKIAPKELDVRSAGYIDSDGDFFAELLIDIAEWGHDKSIVYGEGEVETNIGSESIVSANSYSQETVEFTELNIRSGYIRVDDSVDPGYEINAKLNLFQFTNPASFEATLPKDNGELIINFEDRGLKITKLVFSWNEYNDRECDIEVSVSADAPSCALVSVDPTEDGELYPSYTDIRMLEENEEVFEEVFYMCANDCAPGDKVKITIENADQIHTDAVINLQGRASVEERNSQADEDDFEEDDSLYPFVFCIDPEELADMAEEEDPDEAKRALNSQISMIMDGIANEIDEDARFFVTKAGGQFIEVNSSDEAFEAWGVSSLENVGPWLESLCSSGSYIHVMAILSGNNHWDDGFLRVSSYYEDSPCFTAWGMYRPLGKVACQNYYNGDFDTGIAADPDEDTSYFGSKAMSFYGIKESQFNLETYGIDG